MKKIYFIGLIFFLSFALVACFNKNNNQTDLNQNQINRDPVIPETGRVLDISALAGQTVTTTPGDLIYAKLIGDPNEYKNNYFWVIATPEASQYLSLKDHKITGLENDIGLGGYDNEWWFKVEKTGEFDFGFNYLKPKEKPKKDFKIKIISQ
jgi:predicted secreted protein